MLAAVAALTALTFVHPGATYLHSDTQIYLPILERLWDPGVLSRDLVAERPHVSFTIYDEVALALRRLTGGSFETVLVAQQALFRALGILGVWLAAAALGLSGRMAVLVAAVFSLGATIFGPAVLSIEYEPVPRGFAVPLLLLAMGLAAHGRDILAGVAASLAFLYHPPSVVTFWAVYFLLTLWPSKPQVMSRRILGLAPILAGVVVLMVFSRLQPGVVEPQPFFGRIGDDLERLQRLRTSYNWVSTWIGEWGPHYLVLSLASLLAYRRVRDAAPQDLRFFLAGLPLLGLASVAASYLLLERLKWVVAPQLQPARALVFVTIIAAVLAAVAGVRAASFRAATLRERCFAWSQAFLWFALAYAIPVQTGPRWEPRQLVLVALFAALAAVAAWAEARHLRWSAVPWVAAVVLPFLLMPGAARTPRNPELDDLARWARQATPRNAVFLFPDARKSLEPGVFRARALRPIYVDWKSGGQVNFLPRFAFQWWERWRRTGEGRFKPWHVPAYGRWGIDFFVLPPEKRLPDRPPAYENARYVVYATRR